MSSVPQEDESAETAISVMIAVETKAAIASLAFPHVEFPGALLSLLFKFLDLQFLVLFLGMKAEAA